MKAILAAWALAALAGCASNSGAYQVGPDTYRISTTAITSFGGQATAKAAAIKTATATCSQKGKKLLVTDEGGNAQFTGASVDVTFKCVD